MEKVGTEKFLNDLKAVVETAEELLRATAGNAGEHVANARERAKETLQAARGRLSEIEKEAIAQTRAKLEAADGYVHENPWRSLGVAIAVAFAFGVLVGRRQ